MSIKYSEAFYSLSGEGETCGIPTVYVRLFGCNFTCPAFPCDSEFSWNKELGHRLDIEASGMAKRIVNLLPSKEWLHPMSGQKAELSFTGGEPLLLKNQKNIVAILRELEKCGMLPQRVTIETNATQKIGADLDEYIKEQNTNFFFSCSPKLYSVSGEPNGIKEEIFNSYTSYWHYSVRGQVKVVLNHSDEAWSEFISHVPMFRKHYPIWVMPLGNDAKSQSTTDTAAMVEKALRCGFNISPRLHATIWDDEIGK